MLKECDMELPLSMILFLDNYYKNGDEVVLSGRREFAIGEEDWIGEEIVDPQLLDFPVEVLPVMIHKKPYSNQKLGLHTPSKLYAWRQYTPYQTGRH